MTKCSSAGIVTHEWRLNYLPSLIINAGTNFQNHAPIGCCFTAIFAPSKHTYSARDGQRLHDCFCCGLPHPVPAFIVKDHVKKMISTANPWNVKQIYQGFQKIKRNIQNSGFEMKMWSSSGSIQSPGYRGDYDEDHYKTGRENLYILQFPDNIGEMLGGGSLVIELEVDTRQEEGWQEYVHYMEGSRYKLYKDNKTWAEAESHCQEEGGHLASVTSEWEQEMVEEVAEGLPVWIGGTDQEQEGRWQWVGGADWDSLSGRYGDGRGGQDITACSWMKVGAGWTRTA